MKVFILKYKSWFKYFLLVLVVGFVAQFVKQTDWNVIGNYLQKMPFTFLGVIGLSTIAYALATIAWRLCLGPDGDKVNLWDLFMIRHVGEMLSVFNPTSVIAGETLKVHYLSKHGIAKNDGISSILISRILIVLSAILLIILSVLYFIYNSLITENNGIVIIIGVASFGGFGYLLARFLLHSKMYLHSLITKLQRLFGKKFISDSFCESILSINTATYRFYNDFKYRFYVAFVLSIFHWIFGAAEFYLILMVLGFKVSFINAIAIEMGVILFKTIGAIVPGQIGVEEYANKVMLESVGIESNEVWMVVSIIRRARQLFWVAIAGIFYFLVRKKQNLNS